MYIVYSVIEIEFLFITNSIKIHNLFCLLKLITFLLVSHLSIPIQILQAWNAKYILNNDKYTATSI